MADWIKEIPENFKELESGCSNLIFLYKSDKIYVMDNHLAAGWAWLHELNPDASYDFFHIDQHEDLLDDIPKEKLDFLKDNPHLSLEEYSDRRHSYMGIDYKLFRYNNYIKNISKIFSRWFEECCFAAHNEVVESSSRHSDKLNIRFQPNASELKRGIEEYVGRPSERKWIFNLDLDYFFCHEDEESGIKRIQEDDYIREVIRSIKNNLDNISVLTVAMSPECCGGWDNAIQVMNIVAEELGIDFRL